MKCHAGPFVLRPLGHANGPLSFGAQPGQQGRVFFPYSVVPGGVASVAELKAAIARDPVVAAHYARFDVSKARVTHTDRERMVYVSYRRGNQLYWTKGKLKLAKGEKLITDGVITARSRCGNQVSETPSPLTAPNEPSAKTLDTPDPPDASSTQLYNPDWFNQADWGSNLTAVWTKNPPSAAAGPTGPGPTGLPLFIPPAGNTSNTPVVPVPEPSSLALLLIGLPAIWAYRRKWKT